MVHTETRSPGRIFRGSGLPCKVSRVLCLIALAACNACGDDSPAPPPETGGSSGSSGSSGGTSGGVGITEVQPPPDPSAGCGAGIPKVGFLANESIMVSGAARTYQLFVPDTYDGQKVFPLVFVFHGDGGTGAGIRNSFKLEAEAAGEAIIVYPDGEKKTWSIDGAAGLLKDVGFIDAIATQLATSHCTDKKRVFAVGFSKGAYFTNQLACLSKSNLRAIVTHAGGGPFGVMGSGTSFKNGQLVCPSPPVAALQVQGATDTAVPVTEGMKARDHWRRVNECKTTSTAFAPDPCIAYDGCAAGRPEIYCQIPGLGHNVWPEHGTKVTWAFLKGK